MIRAIVAVLVLVLLVTVGLMVWSSSQGEKIESMSEGASTAVDAAPARDSVLAVVQELFDAIQHRDTAAVRRIMRDDARLVALDARGDTAAVRISSRADFIASLAGTEAHMLERMWSAEVRLDGPMAMVWTPYDFHVDEEFSHCGVDAFDLVRTGRGWRIVSVTYTRNPRERCAEQPA